jgi:hypothetical protein
MVLLSKAGSGRCVDVVRLISVELNVVSFLDALRGLQSLQLAFFASIYAEL